MKKILIISLILLSICSCTNKEEQEKFSYTKIDNKKMVELMAEFDYVIIDVRSKEEYSSSHIKGAINIPYDELETAILPNAKIYFVYCASGSRSKIAAETLINQELTVYDLGGIEEIDLARE